MAEHGELVSEAMDLVKVILIQFSSLEFSNHMFVRVNQFVVTELVTIIKLSLNCNFRSVLPLASLHLQTVEV